MKEPLDHIQRPTVPWRDASEPAVTECGYDARKVKVLTRDDYFRRVKELGTTRTAMITCMTCAQTAARHSTWQEDPRQALRREIEWECGWRRDKNGHRLRDELTAIETLITNNRVEFDELLQALRQRQDWLDRKAKFTAGDRQ